MLEFLKDYQAWLDAGAPQNQPFSRRVGLCVNITTVDGFTPARSELRIALFKDFGDAVYPFNKSKSAGYLREMEKQSMHLNKARNAWVKKMIHES